MGQFFLHEFFLVMNPVLFFSVVLFQLFELLFQLTIDMVQMQLFLLLQCHLSFQLPHSFLLQCQLLPHQRFNRLHLLDQLTPLRATKPLLLLFSFLLIGAIQLCDLQRWLLFLVFPEHFESIFGGLCLRDRVLTEK